MKKLMIAALAVAFAAVAQAAAITWSASGFLYDGAETAAKLPDVAAYLVFAENFSQSALVDAYAAANGDSVKTLEAMTVSGALATGAGASNSSAKVNGSSTFNITSDADAYFVVFANDKMYVSSSATATYDSVAQEASIAFTSITASSKQTFDAADGFSAHGAGWYNVPEPTSGLLLLLGMAGLALKRKVA